MLCIAVGFDWKGSFGYSTTMQTVIQLDDAVLAKAMQIARQNGYDLSHLIEEALRDRIAPAPDVPPATFSRLTTCGGTGLLPGVDLDNSAALLAVMDNEK